jgi:hypothetical protein
MAVGIIFPTAIFVIFYEYSCKLQKKKPIINAKTFVNTYSHSVDLMY